MKCVICCSEVGETFLGKIRGTYVNKKAICQKCQIEIGIKEITTRVGAKK